MMNNLFNFIQFILGWLNSSIKNLKQFLCGGLNILYGGLNTLINILYGGLSILYGGLNSLIYGGLNILHGWLKSLNNLIKLLIVKHCLGFLSAFKYNICRCLRNLNKKIQILLSLFNIFTLIKLFILVLLIHYTFYDNIESIILTSLSTPLKTKIGPFAQGLHKAEHVLSHNDIKNLITDTKTSNYAGHDYNFFIKDLVKMFKFRTLSVKPSFVMVQASLDFDPTYNGYIKYFFILVRGLIESILLNVWMPMSKDIKETFKGKTLYIITYTLKNGKLIVLHKIVFIPRKDMFKKGFPE
jgi:hypothetical protein